MQIEGSFGTGPQMLIVDLSLDAGDNLVSERLVAILTDGSESI